MTRSGKLLARHKDIQIVRNIGEVFIIIILVRIPGFIVGKSVIVDRWEALVPVGFVTLLALEPQVTVRLTKVTLAYASQLLHSILGILLISEVLIQRDEGASGRRRLVEH
jgi:hypothetical protein